MCRVKQEGVTGWGCDRLAGMATTFPGPHTRHFEVHAEPIEVTLGGSLGTRPDYVRKFVSGPQQFYIEGVEVSRDEFRAAYIVDYGRDPFA